MSTVSVASGAALPNGTGLQLDGRNGQVGALSSSALGTGSHILSRGPLAVRAALERGAIDAVPLALHTARSRERARACAGACAGARAGLRAGDRVGARTGVRTRARAAAAGAGCRSVRHRRSSVGVCGRGRSNHSSGRRTGRAGAGARAGARTRVGASAAVTSGSKSGSTGTGGGASGSQVARLAIILDVVTRLRESDVDTFGGGAAVDVGDKHGREGGRALLDIALFLNIGPLRRSALDLEGSTVHVHLTVSNAVEPSPGERVLAGANAVRNGVVEFGRISHGSTTRKVTVHVGGAAAFDRLDDHPFGVLGRLQIGGQTDLAGATTMGGGTLKGQRHALADLGGIPLGDLVGVRAQLARKVAAIGCKRRVVKGVLAIGNGLSHDHVCFNSRNAQESSGRKNGLGKHGEGASVLFCTIRQLKECLKF